MLYACTSIVRDEKADRQALTQPWFCSLGQYWHSRGCPSPCSSKNGALLEREAPSFSIYQIKISPRWCGCKSTTCCYKTMFLKRKTCLGVQAKLFSGFAGNPKSLGGGRETGEQTGTVHGLFLLVLSCEGYNPMQVFMDASCN